MTLSDLSYLPEPLGPLTPLTVRLVPDTPGAYAAWLEDADALEQAGIEPDGDGRALLYVGLSTRSLALRLRRHVFSPFWDLAELLAMRRTVLPAWWVRAQKTTTGRTVRPTPLARVTEDQALGWQYQHVRWGWVPVPRDEVRRVEVELIAERQPLLNLHGQGLRAAGPPQLRHVGRYEAERAEWLLRLTWLAVLTLSPDGWVARPTGLLHVVMDPEGWPLRVRGFSDRGTHAVDLPDGRWALERMAAAAPPDLAGVIEAPHEPAPGVIDTCDPERVQEARAWIAAYLMAPPGDATTPDERVAAALRGQRSGTTPTRLPTGARLRELLDLIDLLPGVAH